MMFGVVFLLFMLGLLVYLLYRAFKKQYYSLAIAVLLIALSMAVNHHFWHISYNVFLLATLANLAIINTDGGKNKYGSEAK